MRFFGYVFPNLPLVAFFFYSHAHLCTRRGAFGSTTTLLAPPDVAALSQSQLLRAAALESQPALSMPINDFQQHLVDIDNVNIELGPPAPKRRKKSLEEDGGSWVRYYFHRLPEDYKEGDVNGRFKCRLLLSAIMGHKPVVSAPIGNVSSNFRRHLQKYHKKEFDEGWDQVQRGLNVRNLAEAHIAASSAKKENPALSSPIWKNLISPSARTPASNDLLLLFWIVHAGLPFAAVEDPLYRAYHARYEVPTISARSLVRLVPLAVEVIQLKLRAVDLREVAFFAATTDAWSDDCLRSFMAITYHFIDEAWNLKSLTLDVFPTPGSHTAEYITDVVQSRVDKWMPDCAVLVAVVADGAAAARKASQMLAGDDGLWCIAHKLQLAVNDFIKDVAEDDVASIRAIVVHQRAHSKCLVGLRDAQVAAHVQQPLSLILDVPTRFSSKFYMIQRVLQLLPYLQAMALDGLFDDMKTTSWPDAASLNRLELLCETMQPFVELTTKVGGEKYPTLSRVPGWLSEIETRLQPSIEDGGTKAKFKNAMLIRFHQRFDSVFTTASTALCAASMDPRFGALPWCTPAVKADVYVREFVRRCFNLQILRRHQRMGAQPKMKLLQMSPFVFETTADAPLCLLLSIITSRYAMPMRERLYLMILMFLIGGERIVRNSWVCQSTRGQFCAFLPRHFRASGPFHLVDSYTTSADVEWSLKCWSTLCLFAQIVPTRAP